MKWVGIGAAVIGVLAALYWFTAVVRKADRAEIANQTVEELQERGKINADLKKLDRSGLCRELDLDVLPDGSGCQ